MAKKINGNKPWQPPTRPEDRDEHHGLGGSYEVKDGKRVLVEGSRTVERPVFVCPVTFSRHLQEDVVVDDEGKPVLDDKTGALILKNKTGAAPAEGKE